LGDALPSADSVRGILKPYMDNEANPPCSLVFHIHEEAGAFWADAEGKMERWTGAADTFEEMVKLCYEAVRVFVGEPCSIVIHFPPTVRTESIQ
jgi:hypothetical protein